MQTLDRFETRASSPPSRAAGRVAPGPSARATDRAASATRALPTDLEHAGHEGPARDDALRRFLVDSPLWISIPAIVAVSVTASLGALFALTELMGLDYGPTFLRSMTIATVAPIVVSAPIGGYIVRLLREVDAARHDAQTLAAIDSLTGLVNRRRMSAFAARVLSPACRQGADCAIALVDIDDFKKINDQFGHDVGDRVLRLVGGTLREVAGGADIVARWGGEEFVVLMPGASGHEARERAQALRAAVDGLSLDAGDGRPVRCTISIGVSSAGYLETFEQMITRADRAMYRAKAGGKNRVAVG